MLPGGRQVLTQVGRGPRAGRALSSVGKALGHAALGGLSVPRPVAHSRARGFGLEPPASLTEPAPPPLV